MSIKILLADDSITIQKVVGIIFGGDDYTLTVVDNGKAAVEKAQEVNPDVLLIDALMPGMSGYEVCEAVRANQALAAKPILLLTGSFEPFDENKAKSCGADGFLAKPFESQQIITKVKELFELGSSRSGASGASGASAPAAPAAADFDLESAAESTIEAPAASNDIWGAFTTEEDDQTVAFDDSSFDVVEETAASTTPAVSPAVQDSKGTGSQWVPVEEETFEFDDESAAKPAAPVFNEPDAFEMDIPDLAPAATPEKPVIAFEEPAAPVAVAPAPAAPQAALTEDQLRAALAGASKEVIERIVWEIVPDLAEVMIKEAIRKIKEGV